jgi:hypothetical protein
VSPHSVSIADKIPNTAWAFSKGSTMPIRHWPKGIQQPVDTLSQVISTLLSIFFSSSLKFGLHIYIYFKKKKQQNHEKTISCSSLF